MLTKVFSALSETVFPSLCFHCHKKLEASHKILCSHCFGELVFFRKDDGCGFDDTELFYAIALHHSAVLETLIRMMSSHRFLIDGIAALTVAGTIEQFPCTPECWTSVKGCQVCKEIASQIAKLTDRPFYPIGSRKMREKSSCLFDIGHHSLEELNGVMEKERLTSLVRFFQPIHHD